MASGFNINTFKSKGLIFGGARPSLFEVFMTVPDAIGISPGSEDRLRFLCRAAQLPAASIESISIPYFGRNIKIAGDRSFADWSIQVMNDEDFKVRAMFEKWSNALNRFESNVRQANLVEENTLAGYKCNIDVVQYGKNGDVIRTCEIVGGFPTSVDAIGLNWSDANSVEEFSVTFAYDYWLPKEGTEQNNEFARLARDPVSI